MRTAVVTGAAGAIGTAICARLVDRGFDVLAVDIDPVRLDDVAGVRPLVADLTDPSSYDEIAAQVSRCDVLVNNAGIVVTTPFEKASRAELVREHRLNLEAPILLTHALFPALQAAQGQVISVASLGALLPLAQSPGYSASKFGLRGFLLALSLRAKETGVRVSIINPASVDTPMLRHEAATGGSPLNFIGEPLTPEEVADAVVRQVDHPRLETNLPRQDGWLVKAVMLNPGLVNRARPILERLARPNLRRYQTQHGLR